MSKRTGEKIMRWMEGCARCKKETQYQTGQIYRNSSHELANWCSKICEDNFYVNSPNCPIRHPNKSKCFGVLRDKQD